MAIIRWAPRPSTAQDLAGIQDEVNRLFDSCFGGGAPRRDTTPGFAPPVDIEETREEFIVRVDLPGVDQKDVKVSVMGDTLTIRGERKQDGIAQDGSLHRVERAYGNFERTFTLGTSVRNDKVRATYRGGVLEVHVPKAEEARAREIEVQIS